MVDQQREARESSRGRRPRRRREAPTPEERAYKEARRRANAKISFYTHAVAFASVIGMLFVIAGPRVALIVTSTWGIGLAVHYFAAMIAPELRNRLIDDEVNRTVQQNVEQGVHRERRAIETRNARSLEDLSASIAHEIRNPITAAKSLVQQMGEDPVSDDNLDYAKVALDELDRVERSISHLLRFARDTELRPESVSLADVVESALDTFRDRFQNQNVDVHHEADALGTIEGDPEKLRRAAINLIGNALDAMAAAETPDPVLEIMIGENLAGSEVWLRVRDNGPGMTDEIRSKIFSPFYTTKDSGTGLGLALTKKVVDAHGGTIEAHSAPGVGSEFVLAFPKASAAGRGAEVV